MASGDWTAKGEWEANGEWGLAGEGRLASGLNVRVQLPGLERFLVFRRYAGEQAQEHALHAGEAIEAIR